MKISCVCPTYGRVTMLRSAIGSFLMQEWPDKELVILNDAPTHIELRNQPSNVFVYNYTGFSSLGAKYNKLLELCDGNVICHWEDDDLFLPWHLSEGARHLLPNPQRVAHVRFSWCIIKRGEVWVMGGRSKYRCEGGLMFGRELWEQLGAYSDEHSAHSVATLQKATRAEKSFRYVSEPTDSYLFCRMPGERQGSGLSKRPKDGKQLFENGNTDFGDGSPLEPVFDDERWDVFRFGVKEKVSEHEYKMIMRRMG